MGRVQLALNVDDLDAAIAFYEKLFGEKPAKVKPGYANFAISDPPLKLVLMEGEGSSGSINHLGVEVESRAEVRQATERFAAEGLKTRSEEGVCCYAAQDKVWVGGADGTRWEVYTVLDDAPLAGEAKACC